MTYDLSKLNLGELTALQSDLAKEIPRRQDKEKQQAITDLRKLAHDRGFNLDELLGSAKGGANKGTRGPAVIKFRSADGMEWTGRGRKPAWVVDHLDKGGKLEDLAV